MSVRVSERNQSKCEYVYNALQLMNLVNERLTKYANKIADKRRYKHFVKSQNFVIWNSPMFHAQQVYAMCQRANRTRDTDKRKQYLSLASENLTLLENSVQTFYEQYRGIVKDKFIILLADKVEIQHKLLGGQFNFVRNISCMHS